MSIDTGEVPISPVNVDKAKNPGKDIPTSMSGKPVVNRTFKKKDWR